MNTVGTASTERSSASARNDAPSMATWRMFGFKMAIRLRACTTSGQFWQDWEKKVSKTIGWLSAAIWASVCSDATGGLPPICKMARTSDVNS